MAAQLAWPAITIPIGLAQDDGDKLGSFLPVGLELLSLPFQEGKMITLGAAIEKLVDRDYQMHGFHDNYVRTE